jgi:hypothetical protein
MLGNDESVYNLIPRPMEQVSKAPMFHSKYKATVPPSCSTFGLHNTTKLTANESGNEPAGFDGVAAGSGHHTAKKGAATFGREVIEEVRADNYLKSTSKAATLPPPSTKYNRSSIAPRKAPIVPRSEKPVMGLVTETDFIKANAKDVIQAAPRRPPPPEAPLHKSANFGKTPKYLDKIKQQRMEEFAYVNEVNKSQVSAEEPRLRQMTEQEKRELTAGLRKKWEDIHKMYQALTFNIDTVTKVQRKEGLEAQMEIIEKSLAKLQKKSIYVYDDLQY